MLDSNDFLNTIKKAAVEAVQASKPTGIAFGTVTSITPLKINIEQKMTLTNAQLVLTQNVTDYKTTISAGNYFYTDNTETIEEREITIHNALRAGDEVILVRMQGGQKYIVLDRVVKT